MAKKNIRSRSHKLSQQRKREKWSAMETMRNRKMSAKLLAVAATGCDPFRQHPKGGPRPVAGAPAKPAPKPKPAPSATPRSLAPVTVVDPTRVDEDGCVEIVMNFGQGPMALDSGSASTSTRGIPLSKLKRPHQVTSKSRKAPSLGPKQRTRQRRKAELPAK
jgi:hypothetical protein